MSVTATARVIDRGQHTRYQYRTPRSERVGRYHNIRYAVRDMVQRSRMAKARRQIAAYTMSVPDIA
eukprot:776107-Rhodomonas_salina.1